MKYIPVLHHDLPEEEVGLFGRRRRDAREEKTRCIEVPCLQQGKRFDRFQNYENVKQIDNKLNILAAKLSKARRSIIDNSEILE